MESLAAEVPKIALQELARRVLASLAASHNRKQVLTHLEAQLRRFRVEEAQVRYIVDQIQSSLGSLAQLTNVEDARDVVVRALGYREQLPPDDPRLLEPELATLALLRAAAIVSLPPPQALLADLTLLDKIPVIFPGLGPILEAHERRQKAPLVFSGETVGSVLQRAGQPDLQVTFSADGMPQFSGTARVTLHLPPPQSAAVAQWMADPQSETLVLSWSDGMRTSYGHPELDALLAPPGGFDLRLEMQPAVHNLRLRVTNGEEARFVDATLTLRPAGKRATLRIGHERLSLEISSASRRSSQITITIPPRTSPLPPEDEVLVEALLLLLRPGGQAFVVQVENPVSKQLASVDKPFLLIGNRGASNQDLLAPLEIQQVLLRLSRQAVQQGFDPLTLTLPDPFENGAAETLLGIGRALYPPTELRRGSLSLSLDPDTYAEVHGKLPAMTHLTQHLFFALGEAHFLVQQPITNLNVLERQEGPAECELRVEGDFGEGALEVLTREQAEQRWAKGRPPQASPPVALPDLPPS